MAGRYDWVTSGDSPGKRDERVLQRRLLGYVRPHARTLALAGVLMLGVAAATSASALIVKNILDDVLIKQDRAAFLLVLAGILAISLAKGAFSYGQSVLMASVGQRVIRRLQDELYTHVVRLSYSFFSEVPVGTLISRIAGDVNNVQGLVTVAVTGAVRDFFSILGLIVVVFYQDWKLALISFTVGPLVLWALRYSGSRMRKASRQIQVKNAEMVSHLAESLGGIRVVKAFGAEEVETGRFRRITQDLYRLAMRMMRVSALSRPLMEFIGALMLAGVVLYGGSAVMRGEMTVGSFFSFITALLLMYEPIKRLNAMNNTIQLGLASAERAFAILDLPPEVADAPGAEELPRVRGEVSFEDVRFRYQERFVIDGVSMKAESGRMIALVGGSGGGKSTLVNLIPRFYEATGGTVRVDGHDVSRVTQASLRRNIAMVAQETILFNDTVRANIAYGTPGASPELVEGAARAAYVHDVIMDLPAGYDTVIGTGGIKLSGGQRQRVAIARALLKDAPILILDEATSALDAESEAVVQKALENLMRGRTTFVIAHRLSTVRNADRICVLSEGRVVEEGTHDELLAKSGEYAHYYRMQFREE
jgi:subfamily B ATP-binding cassette protein MsbA